MEKKLWCIQFCRKAQGMVEYAVIMAFVVVLIATLVQFADVRAGVMILFDSVADILLDVQN